MRMLTYTIKNACIMVIWFLNAKWASKKWMGVKRRNYKGDGCPKFGSRGILRDELGLVPIDGG